MPKQTVNELSATIEQLQSQMAELSRLYVQVQRADADALQFFDQPPKRLEHVANLVLPAFRQPHFVPGIC